MAQRRRHQSNRKPPYNAGPRESAPREEPRTYERRPPTQYGKAFVVMEDAQQNTFEFAAGKWVEHGVGIASYRENCQVKELPQKVNGMTRYEIRRPI